MAEGQSFLSKYGKIISIILIVIVFGVMTWYLFFEDKETSDGEGTGSAIKYKPSSQALQLRRWDERGWEEPNGNGAWWATSLVGGKTWKETYFENNSPDWYDVNERKMNGWFKGMDLNPNSTNGGYWKQAAPDIKAYLALKGIKDFDDVKVGELVSNS